MTFLKINNLSIEYKMRKETVNAAKNINIDINKGEIVGLVGESGSGKSTVANAIVNLIDEPGKISNGSIFMGDTNISENQETIIQYRGKKNRIDISRSTNFFKSNSYSWRTAN